MVTKDSNNVKGTISLHTRRGNGLQFPNGDFIVGTSQAIARNRNDHLRTRNVRLDGPLFKPVDKDFASLHPKRLGCHTRARTRNPTTRQIATKKISGGDIRIRHYHTTRSNARINKVRGTLRRNRPPNVPTRLFRNTKLQALGNARRTPNRFMTYRYDRRLPIDDVGKYVPTTNRSLHHQTNSLPTLRRRKSQRGTYVRYPKSRLKTLNGRSTFFKFRPATRLILHRTNMKIRLQHIGVHSLSSVKRKRVLLFLCR